MVTRAHKWLNQPDERAGIYNSWDCIATARLTVALDTELRDNGQYDYYRHWFEQLGPAVLTMQRRGFGQLDHDSLNKTRAKYRRELREVEGLISAKMSDPSLYDEKFFNSPKQKAKFLFDELSLTPAPKTKKRTARSTEQAALVFVLQHLRKRDEPHVSVLYDLFHRSRLNTIYSRYLSPEVGPDGRLYPTVKLYGTETHRFAYANPPLQQWPLEIRHLVRPRPGHLFLSVDRSQLEARISAYMSGDTVEIAVFEQGLDPHRQNAMDLFSLTDSDWSVLTNSDAYRNTQLRKMTAGGGDWWTGSETRCCTSSPADWPGKRHA